MGNKIDNKISKIIIDNYYSLSSKELINITGVSKPTILKIAKENNLLIKSSKKYNLNENYFSIINTEENAYWLGFLYADGYVRQRKRSPEMRLKLKLSDKCHLELFKKCLNSEHIIKDIISNVTVKGRTHTSHCSTFSVYNGKIVNDLTKLGCMNNKTFILKIPDIKEDLMNHFLRGYFDGDGTICIDKNNKNRLNFTSGSLVFLEQIQEIFLKNGIRKLKITRYSSYSRISWSTLLDITNIYNYLYKNSNIFLERKKKIFNKIIINNG